MLPSNSFEARHPGKSERERLALRAKKARIETERAKDRHPALTLTPGKRWHRHVMFFVEQIQGEMITARRLDGGPGWIDGVAAAIETFLFDTELTPDEVISDRMFGNAVDRHRAVLMHKLSREYGIPNVVLARIFNHDSTLISHMIRRIDGMSSQTPTASE